MAASTNGLVELLRSIEADLRLKSNCRLLAIPVGSRQLCGSCGFFVELFSSNLLQIVGIG